MFGTGDTLANHDRFMVLPFNAADWLQPQVEGQIVSMCQASNWEQAGLITTEQAIIAMAAAYDDLFYMPDPTGQIIAYALTPSNLPLGCLYCDGSTHPTTTYPVLFGKIGYTFGGSGANFAVPDLRGRSVVGVGTGSGLSPRALGDVLGEETHILTTPEIPSHAHSVPATLDGLAVAPGELPVLTPVPLASVNTGSTGGDGSHNNMQPSFSLTYAIITGQ